VVLASRSGCALRIRNGRDSFSPRPLQDEMNLVRLDRRRNMAGRILAGRCRKRLGRVGWFRRGGSAIEGPSDRPRGPFELLGLEHSAFVAAASEAGSPSQDPRSLDVTFRRKPTQLFPLNPQGARLFRLPEQVLFCCSVRDLVSLGESSHPDATLGFDALHEAGSMHGFSRSRRLLLPATGVNRCQNPPEFPPLLPSSIILRSWAFSRRVASRSKSRYLMLNRTKSMLS
jgi:hypothetical protein